MTALKPDRIACWCWIEFGDFIQKRVPTQNTMVAYWINDKSNIKSDLMIRQLNHQLYSWTKLVHIETCLLWFEPTKFAPISFANVPNFLSILRMSEYNLVVFDIESCSNHQSKALQPRINSGKTNASNVE